MYSMNDHNTPTPIKRCLSLRPVIAHRYHEAAPPLSSEKGRLSWYCLPLITLIFLSFLTSSCRETTPHFSPAERQKLDSLVLACRDIPALAKKQKELEGEGNRLGSITALREWGRALRNESRFDEALRVHSEGLRQAESLGDTIEWVRALNDIGTDYRRMGVLDVAQEYHYLAHTISEESADTTFASKKNQVISLNGLGNIYMTLGNYEQAEQVLRLALAGEKRLQSKVGQAINYANLGSIFESQGKMDSAWVYYRYSMALNQEAGSTLGISLCHTFFGSLYQKEHQYDEAEREYQAAYALMKASKDEWHALTSLIALASIYNATKDDAHVEEYLRQAKTIAERIRSNEHLSEIHALYYRYYSRLGDYRRALENKEIAESLQDSVVSIEKMNRIQNVSINIERNRQRQQMNEVQLKLQAERTKRNVGFGIFALTVFFLIGIVAILLYIQRLRARTHRTLRKMSSMRENFFTNVTHEFRTPLTVILGLSHDLQQRDPEPHEVKEKLSVIERQGKNLLALINQLLDISRIKSAVGDSDWRSGDITTQIQMLVETYRDYAESRRIDLQYYAREAIEMDFVPDYLEKVLNNLLSNALKFTPEGGRISVKTWREEEQMFLEVADTGEGIPPEAVPHIFEPFYKAESNLRGMSSGVGLALVKQIIDAISGDIQVISTVGVGTTFMIRIPVRHEGVPTFTPPPTATVPLKPEAPLEDQTENNDCRLLIIEDNQDIARYIGTLLSDRYAVYYAPNGKEGLERALDLVPDLIITDLMMPEMDGLEVCQSVRGNEIIDHIPIIVVTAKISEEERIRGIKAGADAYLTKPFNSDELRALVELLLERHRRLQHKSEEITSTSDETDVPHFTEAEQRFLDRTVDLIALSLGKRKIEVNALAEGLCMSPRQLHRKLVALTGYTPAAYILSVKMQRAKQLLESQPGLTIEDISERCGFEHESSFYHAFKKMYGVTPAEYRRNAIPSD